MPQICCLLFLVALYLVASAFYMVVGVIGSLSLSLSLSLVHLYPSFDLLSQSPISLSRVCRAPYALVGGFDSFCAPVQNWAASLEEQCARFRSRHSVTSSLLLVH